MSSSFNVMSSGQTFSGLVNSSNSEKFIEKLTKIQAVVRGHQVRKSLDLRKKYDSNPKKLGSTTTSTMDKFFQKDDKIQYIEDYKFPNGAIYTGIL